MSNTAWWKDSWKKFSAILSKKPKNVSVQTGGKKKTPRFERIGKITSICILFGLYLIIKYKFYNETNDSPSSIWNSVIPIIWVLGTFFIIFGLFVITKALTKMRKSRKQKIAMQNQQQNAQGNANTAQPVAPAPNNAVAQANGTVIVLLCYIMAIIGGIVIWNVWPSNSALADQRVEMRDQPCIDPKTYTFDSHSELRPAVLKHERERGKVPLKGYHLSVVGGELIGTDKYNNPIHLHEGEQDLWGDQYEILFLKVAAGDVVKINLCYYEKPF